VKQKATVLLFAIFFPILAFAQVNTGISDLLTKCKEQYLKHKQKSFVQQSNVDQNMLAKQMSSYSTPFYISRYSEEGGGYYSSSLYNISETNLLRSAPAPSELLCEGTMDDNGNWWGLVFNLFGVGDGNSDEKSLQKNTSDDEEYRNLILKIDKSNGAIVQRIALSTNFIYLGIAFNPIDKLIYFTGYEKLGSADNGNKLSKGGAPGTILYSLNPVTSEINEVGFYNEIFFGLACTNSGVFYSLGYLDGGSSYPLVKFTAEKPGFEQIGCGIESDDFELFFMLIDMEMDRNAEKCYLQALNLAGGSPTIVFREISLASGTSLPVYNGTRDGFIISGGLAFDETTVVAPPSSGKLVITAPNGGEKLTGGKYQYITWTKSSGIIPGAIQLEYSTDGGVTWKKINNAPIAGVMRYSWLVPNNINSIRCLVRIVNYLTRKEYDRSDRVFAINTATAAMAANFPNPFNPSTKIVFTIAKSAQTTLRVYNALGQQVAELVNKQLESGVHEYEFNAANLPSGVYIYKLESDGASEMHKMILMK